MDSALKISIGSIRIIISGIVDVSTTLIRMREAMFDLVTPNPAMMVEGVH
ncbi:hypothetical protein YSY22_52010 [Brevibacillus formosus]